MFESSSKGQKTKSIKIQKLMKTTFYITVAILGLQSNLLFANGSSAQTVYSDLVFYPSVEIVNTASEMSLISAAEMKELAPVVPVEADFIDNDLVTLSIPTSPALAPVTPREADFEDSDADNLNLLLPDLAPKAPGEADFQDADFSSNGEAVRLAPSVPSEAIFEDLV
jgi:hypothetical protein